VTDLIGGSEVHLLYLIHEQTYALTPLPRQARKLDAGAGGARSAVGRNQSIGSVEVVEAPDGDDGAGEEEQQLDGEPTVVDSAAVHEDGVLHLLQEACEEEEDGGHEEDHTTEDELRTVH
jgi:hypothetical protein